MRIIKNYTNFILKFKFLILEMEFKSTLKPESSTILAQDKNLLIFI